MWLSLSASMKLGMWDPKTEKITEYDLPMEYGHPYGCAVDQNDTVWYTDFFSMFVAGFDPDTETYTVYPQPSEGPRADVRSIAVGPDGNIWFTDIRYNKVTKLDPDGLAHIGQSTNVSRR
jgi:streptogramin lyase